MNEPAVRDRRRWRIRLGAFLMVPVVCAVVIVAIVRWPRVSVEGRMKQEDDWILDPTPAKFWPEDGAWRRWDDPVLKVASVSTWPGQFGGRSRGSRLVDRGGLVRAWEHVIWDRWDKTYPLRPESSAALPGLLAKLPPSDPAATPGDMLCVAYPEWGRWVVRKYRLSAAPKEALAVSNALSAKAPTNE